MFIGFGKYRGTSAEFVVLKHPDYVMSVLGGTASTEAFGELADEFRRLIDRFDGKPILARCREEGCDACATGCTLYRRQVLPHWWCDDCDPAVDGPLASKLFRVGSYREACRYVAAYCDGRRADLAVLIREIARAKGLGTRLTESEVASFFA